MKVTPSWTISLAAGWDRSRRTLRSLEALRSEFEDLLTPQSRRDRKRRQRSQQPSPLELTSPPALSCRSDATTGRTTGSAFDRPVQVICGFTPRRRREPRGVESLQWPGRRRRSPTCIRSGRTVQPSTGQHPGSRGDGAGGRSATDPWSRPWNGAASWRRRSMGRAGPGRQHLSAGELLAWNSLWSERPGFLQRACPTAQTVQSFSHRHPFGSDVVPMIPTCLIRSRCLWWTISKNCANGCLKSLLAVVVAAALCLIGVKPLVRLLEAPADGIHFLQLAPVSSCLSH